MHGSIEIEDILPVENNISQQANQIQEEEDQKKKD